MSNLLSKMFVNEERSRTVLAGLAAAAGVAAVLAALYAQFFLR